MCFSPAAGSRPVQPAMTASSMAPSARRENESEATRRQKLTPPPANIAIEVDHLAASGGRIKMKPGDVAGGTRHTRDDAAPACGRANEVEPRPSLCRIRGKIGRYQIIEKSLAGIIVPMTKKWRRVSTRGPHSQLPWGLSRRHLATADPDCLEVIVQTCTDEVFAESGRGNHGRAAEVQASERIYERKVDGVDVPRPT